MDCVHYDLDSYTFLDTFAVKFREYSGADYRMKLFWLRVSFATVVKL